MRRPLLLACVLVTSSLAACTDDPSATITITLGEELDAMSRNPAPTTLVVELLDVDGKATEIARTALPADELSLGKRERTEVGALRVTALDGAGKTLLKGESLYLQFGALENASSPLEVFLQRTGELARMPRGPGSFEAPLLGITVARYLVATSGTGLFLYDLLLLKPITGLPAFTRPAKSMVTFGTASIIIDEQGASTIDLSTGDAQDLTAPAGGTFAEIAGGSTVVLPDGSAFVVGGTRSTGGASSRVLSITKEGAVAFATLATPREGACATWVEGRGLLVVGGSATGPGAEVLAPGTAQGAGLAYPPDAVRGCGASTLDASHVLVAGGVGSPVDVAGAAPPRVLDLACAAMCAPLVWPATPPLPLVRAESFTLAPDAVFLAGDDATGNTRAFRASAGALTEIAVKAPRRNARIIALPIKGTVALFGGGPASIEQYRE
jgi:hypothetical protein